jgi:hypothetical protein
MAAADTLIIELEVEPAQLVLMQGLLQGEDGLAVMRCFDPEHRKQQLWTTPAMRAELCYWLESLSDTLPFRICGEWLWQPDGEA